MNLSLDYLLMPLMASLLVLAQASWGGFVKNTKPFYGSLPQIAIRFITSPRIWGGAILYVCALGVYFFMLSRFKFFVVQVVMSALAVTFSCILSVILFHEKISTSNVIGILLIIFGIALTVNTSKHI